jgi:hypothetical protein
MAGEKHPREEPEEGPSEERVFQDPPLLRWDLMRFEQV